MEISHSDMLYDQTTDSDVVMSSDKDISLALWGWGKALFSWNMPDIML